jgi:hypothetical protein
VLQLVTAGLPKKPGHWCKKKNAPALQQPKQSIIYGVNRISFLKTNVSMCLSGVILLRLGVHSASLDA